MNRSDGNPARPTLRDVAEVAGLSVTQTSRALNGHSDVADTTRRRAEAAAREVGYRPNLEARRLKMPDARAQSIGLVLSSPEQRFSDPFLGDLLTSIAGEAARHDFELQLSTSSDTGDVLSVYRRIMQAKRVDGFILLRVASDDPRIDFLLRERYPFVTLGRPAGLSGFASVSESPDSLRTTVQHLAGLGHRSLAAIALPPGFAMAEQRLLSFERAIGEAGLTVPASSIVAAEGYHQDSGFSAAQHLLAKPDRPTAVVAFNDLLSMGVMRAAKDRGLIVPDDLSLVAVDDTIVAGNVSPPLTAVRNPAADYGRLLVTQLLATIDKGLHDDNISVEPELILRSSTTPPAG